MSFLLAILLYPMFFYLLLYIYSKFCGTCCTHEPSVLQDLLYSCIAVLHDSLASFTKPPLLQKNTFDIWLLLLMLGLTNTSYTAIIHEPMAFLTPAVQPYPMTLPNPCCTVVPHDPMTVLTQLYSCTPWPHDRPNPAVQLYPITLWPS